MHACTFLEKWYKCGDKELYSIGTVTLTFRFDIKGNQAITLFFTFNFVVSV